MSKTSKLVGINDINNLCNKYPTAKLMLRIGSDDMYSVQGKCRNRRTGKENLLRLLDEYSIYLEESECTNKKIVFHAYID